MEKKASPFGRLQLKVSPPECGEIHLLRFKFTRMIGTPSSVSAASDSGGHVELVQRMRPWHR